MEKTIKSTVDRTCLCCGVDHGQLVKINNQFGTPMGLFCPQCADRLSDLSDAGEGGRSNPKGKFIVIRRYGPTDIKPEYVANFTRNGDIQWMVNEGGIANPQVFHWPYETFWATFKLKRWE